MNNKKCYSLVWSPEELKILKQGFEDEKTHDEISVLLLTNGYARSWSSVRDKLKKLKGSINITDKINFDIQKPDVLLSKRTINKVVSSQYLDLVKEGLKQYGKNNIYKPKSFLPKDESLVFVISDLHIGKKVSFNGVDSYNLNIWEDRFKKLENNFFDTFYRHIKSHSSINEIVIAMAGDMVDGELIYDTQHAQIDTNSVKQVVKATSSLWGFIDKVSNVDKKIPVRVVCVKGNHGKIKDASDETNWDLSLYYQLKFASEITKKSNVYFEISDEDFILFDVKGKKCLMKHSVPKDVSSSSSKHKFGGWNAQHKFDFIISGHWHTTSFSDYCKRPVFWNGSLVGTDDLAEEMGTSSDPQQWCFGISNKRMPTFMYRLDTIE